MPNLFTEELEAKFLGAIDDKENSPFKEKIALSLRDIIIQDEWVSLKKSKSEIIDQKTYDKYREGINRFFNTICEKIKAPAVDAFMEWFAQFTKVNELNCALFRQHLIDNYQYADYADKIDSILQNKGAIDCDANSPKLFDTLLKSASKTIKNDVDLLIAKPDLFDTNAVPFLEVLSSKLSDLNEIVELGYSLPAQLFTEEQISGSIEYYLDIIEDGIKYLNEVKTVKYLGQDNSRSYDISYRIEDLKSFMNKLSDFGIAKSSSPGLKIIFEKVKFLIIGKQGTLTQQWDEFIEKSWTPLESYYDVITAFFLERNGVDASSLRQGRGKWQLGGLSSNLNFIVEKFEEITRVNPLENLEKIPAKDLPDLLLKKCNAITDLNNHCSILRRGLLDLFNAKVEEFNLHKIPIAETISISTPSVGKQLAGIKENIKALGLMNSEDYAEKPFLIFLSKDFDSFFDIYELLDSAYTNILSNTGLKENIDWLNEKLKGSESLELNELDIENSEKLKVLVKVNLIKLTLSKKTLTW